MKAHAPGISITTMDHRAFSLTELLVTVAIMALLGVASVPALQSLQASKLTNSGNNLADLINQARQVAISRNTQTALVIATDTGDSTLNNRLFCLVEYRTDTQAWIMTTAWKLLPSEVSIDNTASNIFLGYKPTVTPSIGDLKFAGKTIAAGHYTYQVFQSDGSMDNSQLPSNSTPVLRLVLNHAAVQSNYYDIVLNVFTGIPKIERP